MSIQIKTKQRLQAKPRIIKDKTDVKKMAFIPWNLSTIRMFINALSVAPIPIPQNTNVHNILLSMFPSGNRIIGF